MSKSTLSVRAREEYGASDEPPVSAKEVFARHSDPVIPFRSFQMRDGRCMTARDLAVGSVDRDGPVRVEDDLPAEPVDADIVMELAQKYAILY